MELEPLQWYLENDGTKYELQYIYFCLLKREHNQEEDISSKRASNHQSTCLFVIRYREGEELSKVSSLQDGPSLSIHLFDLQLSHHVILALLAPNIEG